MNNLPTVLKVEQTFDNEWFTGHLVRNDGVRLFAHVEYKKWGKEAKRRTKEIMDSVEEPLYAFIHNQQHYKFLTSLGFMPTGNVIKSDFPGKEGQAFGEVVYHKKGIDSYAISVYTELANEIIPFAAIDGYGKIQEIEERLKGITPAKWTTKHHFSSGVYTRETFIPSGTCLTGFRHKQETVSILAVGAITVLAVDKQGHATDFGVMLAPQIIVTKAGMKKIGLAHEDTVFINAFPLEGIPEEYHNEEHILQLEEYIFDKEEICLG